MYLYVVTATCTPCSNRLGPGCVADWQLAACNVHHLLLQASPRKHVEDLSEISCGRTLLHYLRSSTDTFHDAQARSSTLVSTWTLVSYIELAQSALLYL